MSKSKQLTQIFSTSPQSSPLVINFEYQEKSEHHLLHFSLQAPLNHAWHTNSNYSDNPVKNWGLWEFDVVELFWQPRTDAHNFHCPYFEWQLSPNGKAFALEIYRPRISYATPLICPINFQTSLSVVENKQIWNATFVIPVKNFPTINLIAIGAFAIMGAPGQKSYYSLTGEKTTKPDFHQPQHFLLLSEL